MILRIYESGKLDLETVGDMLWQADKQANFHPDSRWIHSSTFGTNERGKIHREFSIRWIGREAVVIWLTSNQILFEVLSFKILPEEQEALEGTLAERGLSEPVNHLN